MSKFVKTKLMLYFYNFFKDGQEEDVVEEVSCFTFLTDKLDDSFLIKNDPLFRQTRKYLIKST